MLIIKSRAAFYGLFPDNSARKLPDAVVRLDPCIRLNEAVLRRVTGPCSRHGRSWPTEERPSAGGVRKQMDLVAVRWDPYRHGIPFRTITESITPLLFVFPPGLALGFKNFRNKKIEGGV